MSDSTNLDMQTSLGLLIRACGVMYEIVMRMSIRFQHFAHGLIDLRNMPVVQLPFRVLLSRFTHPRTRYCY